VIGLVVEPETVNKGLFGADGCTRRAPTRPQDISRVASRPFFAEGIVAFGQRR
jgi:hypothetical protein